jgi:hypothetical protein
LTVLAITLVLAICKSDLQHLALESLAPIFLGESCASKSRGRPVMTGIQSWGETYFFQAAKA